MPNKSLPDHLTRRRLIAGAASAGVALVAAPALLRSARAQSWLPGDPFSLGVASGAPRPDGFVLWTRLAPEPLSPDPATPGGMRGGDVAGRYEIATDPRMRDIVRRGDGHGRSGLCLFGARRGPRPRSRVGPYWYRFMRGDARAASAAP